MNVEERSGFHTFSTCIEKETRTDTHETITRYEFEDYTSGARYRWMSHDFHGVVVGRIYSIEAIPEPQFEHGELIEYLTGVHIKPLEEESFSFSLEAYDWMRSLVSFEIDDETLQDVADQVFRSLGGRLLVPLPTDDIAPYVRELLARATDNGLELEFEGVHQYAYRGYLMISRDDSFHSEILCPHGERIFSLSMEDTTPTLGDLITFYEESKSFLSDYCTEHKER